MRDLRRVLPVLLCFGIAFALYLVTMAPGVHWGDHAELQLAAQHPEAGIGVRSYPLFMAMAAGVVRAFSLDAAFGANLVTAFFGALAVALCHFYVFSVFGSRVAAFVAAFSLTVCHLLWTFAAVAEVYTLAACFLFLILITAEWSLRNTQKGAFFLGLTAGISLLHHRMIQVAAVSLLLVLLVLWYRRGTLQKGLLFGLLGTLVGSLPIAILFLLVAHPAGPTDLVRTFLLGGFATHLPSGLGLGSGLLGLLLYAATFMAFNLAGPQGFAFLLSFRRRRVPWPGHRSLLFAFVAGSLPVLLLMPHVGDRYVLLLPAICAAVVLAGIAAAECANRAWLRVLIPVLCLICPPIFYGTLLTTDLSERIGLFRGANQAHREEFVWPGAARDRSAPEFADRVFRVLPPNALVLSAWADGTVLQYVHQVQGLRPDVEVRQVLGRGEFKKVVLGTRGRRVFMTTYPHTPPERTAPPGYVLKVVIPDALWEIKPADTR